jgi:SAM-dependent methyltransferase
MRCTICQNQEHNQILEAREMMIGLREPFRYLVCRSCGAVQLLDAPADMARFYAAGYYSFSQAPTAEQAPLFAEMAEQFIKTYLKRLPGNARVLDVGCGAGHLVYGLAELGYQSVGIDPFLGAEQSFANGAQLLQCDLHHLPDEPSWDVILFNHSFEHLFDQRETLLRARSLLTQRGMLIVRMPTVSSYAWETYGRDWVALDAPRHTVLHSQASLGLLAGQTGLRVRATLYDSSEFQFIGSEQYQRDIPLYGDDSYLVNPERSPFSAADIDLFRQHALQLNQQQRGDTAAFYLTRI